MTSQPPRQRWQNRYDNFRRAFHLLREGIEALETGTLTQLEREGLIQRFEYTWELAWKTLSDVLQYEGINLDTVTPRGVIRAGLEAQIITNGPDWMAALDDRNKMSHTYSFQAFEDVIASISSRYLARLDELNDYLMTKSLSEVDGQN